jgi:hypothetical protein
MRSVLEGPLAEGVDRAGRVVETALLRAVRTGKFGFEDLKRVALAAMAEIAAAAIRSGIASLTEGKKGGGGRDVRVSIRIDAGGGGRAPSPGALVPPGSARGETGAAAGGGLIMPYWLALKGSGTKRGWVKRFDPRYWSVNLRRCAAGGVRVLQGSRRLAVERDRLVGGRTPRFRRRRRRAAGGLGTPACHTKSFRRNGYRRGSTRRGASDHCGIEVTRAD